MGIYPTGDSEHPPYLWITTTTNDTLPLQGEPHLRKPFSPRGLRVLGIPTHGQGLSLQERQRKVCRSPVQGFSPSLCTTY